MRSKITEDVNKLKDEEVGSNIQVRAEAESDQLKTYDNVDDLLKALKVFD
ncbi:hypothetical protein [Aerococcus urinae]|uniref:Uncharacterized protein n=1 Tax=Aerococcus urinae TaxID=1376 RepID=A0A7T2VTF6_9LACT|nr:hypothetical protein [Aerococcus urinae]MCY3033027.1 hypothetical protein [Aerococcus urinae]MCY3038171.1 hypothetical protein [Aerococcus urinae]MCY3045073.1 hypothetical protein [Aerococcus urinae]MCY3046233.1 hypothetical protein [Aerococcus urinae]MCY3048528.1 hypothetical protein [Aerococcus urinae]